MPVTKEEITPHDWLIKEGYPLTMLMTRDNLRNIIIRYAAIQTAERDDKIDALEKGIVDSVIPTLKEMLPKKYKLFETQLSERDARIKELEKIKWIDVSDLPKTSGNYLVLDETLISPIQIKWFDAGYKFANNITHYQPLPEAPTQLLNTRKG